MQHGDRRGERSPPQFVRTAFHDVHGSRLHGFALLLSLGDRASAARLTGAALSEGAERADELRHPERAAAWLRSRVLRTLRRSDGSGQPFAVRMDGLSPLGVEAAALSGLAALAPRERAALIADEIERLDRRDVGAVLGLSGAALDRLIRGARRRYAEAYGQALYGMPTDTGPLTELLRGASPTEPHNRDPHEAVGDWIAAGARHEPGPDLARHASRCRICLRSAASIDALRMIDPGVMYAPSMASDQAEQRPLISLGALRAAVGASAAVLMAAILATNVGGLLTTSSNSPATGTAGTPSGGVLSESQGQSQPPGSVSFIAGGGTPTPGAAGGASAPSASASAILPGATVTPIDPTTDPTAQPPFGFPTPSPGATASATALPQPTPGISTPAPSSPPTQTPFPTPSPTVTSTPAPSPSPTNAAPVAQDDAFIAEAGVALVGAPGVLANDTDSDGDQLTAIKTSDPASGTLDLRSDGSFTYTADPLSTAEFVTFGYVAFDGTTESFVATVTITLSSVLPDGVIDNGPTP